MKILLRCIVILGVVGAMIASPTAAWAISNPDSVNIQKIHATQNILETGDLLIMAEYTISYASVPDETIAEAFIFRLMDTDGSTELGRVLAYPMVTGGYGKGVISFYFDNSTAPGTEAYIIRISGNPAVFSTPYSQDFTMPMSAYTAYSSSADTDIRTQVLIYASDLDPTYEPALGSNLEASDGTVISLTLMGEIYFINAIPNLRNLSPSLFLVQEEEAEATVDTYNGTQSSAYAGRFVGTWVVDSSDAAGELLNIDGSIAMSVIIFIVGFLWVVLSYKAFGTANGGYIPFGITLFAGVLLGWVSMAVMSVIVFICGVYVGMILIGKMFPS